MLLRPKWSLIPSCRHIHFIRYDSVFENLHRNSVYSILCCKMEYLVIEDGSLFNVTSVVRAAIGSVNLLAK